MKRQPLGEEGGDDFPELVIEFLAPLQQLGYFPAKARVGLHMLDAAGEIQFAHVLLLQREVIVRVILQPAQYLTVRIGQLDQVENLEQHLVLRILPDEGAGFSHGPSLDPESGLRHHLRLRYSGSTGRPDRSNPTRPNIAASCGYW